MAVDGDEQKPGDGQPPRLPRDASELTRPALGEVRKRGIAASPGIAVGRAYVVDRRRSRRPSATSPRGGRDRGGALRRGDRRERPAARADQAQARAREGEDHFHILEAHQLMLHDEHLVDATRRRIRDEKINAEWALRRTVEEIKQRVRRDRGRVLPRAAQRRRLRRRAGAAQPARRGGRGPVAPPPDAVVVAHDLSPADTAQLHRAAVGGASSPTPAARPRTPRSSRGRTRSRRWSGSRTSPHAVGTGDLVIVDGTRGEVILNPTPATVAQFRRGRARGGDRRGAARQPRPAGRDPRRAPRAR